MEQSLVSVDTQKRRETRHVHDCVSFEVSFLLRSCPLVGQVRCSGVFPFLCILRWPKGSLLKFVSRLVKSIYRGCAMSFFFGRGSLGAPSVNADPESLHDVMFYATVVEVAEILRSAQACRLCTTAHALADRRSSKSAMWRLRPSWMQRRAPSQEPSKRFGVWDPHENPGHRPNDRNPVTSQSEVESGKHLRCRWRK